MPYVCTHKRYIYGKYYFELAKTGPIPLNMDGTPRKGISDPFYKNYKEWLSLPNREDYRVVKE